MKTKEQIEDQRDTFENQLVTMREHIESLDVDSIEYKQCLLQWAKCIESGKEALDWVLSDGPHVNLVY